VQQVASGPTDVGFDDLANDVVCKAGAARVLDQQLSPASRLQRGDHLLLGPRRRGDEERGGHLAPDDRRDALADALRHVPRRPLRAARLRLACAQRWDHPL
jgi:hypothetical protein